MLSLERHLDSLIVAAVRDELSNGPDARCEIPCPGCAGGADGTVTWERVVEWRVYPEFAVRVSCDGCNYTAEVTL